MLLAHCTREKLLLNFVNNLAEKKLQSAKKLIMESIQR